MFAYDALSKFEMPIAAIGKVRAPFLGHENKANPSLTSATDPVLSQSHMNPPKSLGYFFAGFLLFHRYLTSRS